MVEVREKAKETIVVSFRLPVDEVEFIEEYARRMDVTRAALVQYLFVPVIDRMRELPLPPEPEPRPPQEHFEPVLLPQHTSWWNRYKQLMRETAVDKFLEGHDHGS